MPTDVSKVFKTKCSKKKCMTCCKLSNVLLKGPYIKYVGVGPEDFCGGHEIF